MPQPETSWASVGLRECAELLAAVMSSPVGPQQHAAAGDLHGVAHQPHADDLAAVGVADAVAGSGEAHVARRVDLAQHLGARRWSRRLGDLRPAVHLLVVFGQVPTGVRGHDDAVVCDVQQAVLGLDGHGLSGQEAADVIAELQDADPAVAIHASRDHARRRRCGLGICQLSVDDLEGLLLAQLEAAQRWHVTDRLMVAVGVVGLDPCIEGVLCVVDRLEAMLSEEVLAQRAMQSLDLPGRGRRVRGGEDVLDAVVQADAVEQHGGALQAAGEDLAVVSEDLLGDAVSMQGLEQRVAYRPGRGPLDESGHDAEARVVVDPRHHRQRHAVRQSHVAHDVDLPGQRCRTSTHSRDRELSRTCPELSPAVLVEEETKGL